MSKVPTLTTKDTALKRFSEAVRQELDALTDSNSPRRAPSISEIQALGLLDLASADVTPPPTPFELDATGAFNVVILSWGVPTQGNTSHFEIWRNDTDELVNAILVGTTSAQMYNDGLGASREAYYWVRAVSSGNVIGAFNSIDGTFARTARDPTSVRNALLARRWEAATAYQQFEVVTAATPVLTVANIRVVFQVSVAGISHATTEPNWAASNVLGAQVVDGTVTWTAVEAGTAPFIIGLVNGQQVVSITDAAIQDASITNAKIALLAVDEAQIAEAAVTNAKIGNIIESYGADPENGAGWRIRKDGTIDAAGIVIRDPTGAIILSSGTGLPRVPDKVLLAASLVPNPGLDLEDENDKPAGIKATQGLTDSSGLQRMVEGGVSFMRLYHPSIQTIAYGFPAIPIDDKMQYRVVIRHRANAASASGRYLRVHETSGSLDLAKTHIGTTGIDKSPEAQSFTSYKDLASNAAMPGTDWVVIGYTYTPTIGTRYASLSFYNWSGHGLNSYDVESVTMYPITPVLTAANISTYIANLAVTNAVIGDAAVTTLKIGNNQVTVPSSSYTAALYTIDTAARDNWYNIKSVYHGIAGSPSIIVVSFYYYLLTDYYNGNGATFNLRLRHQHNGAVYQIDNWKYHGVHVDTDPILSQGLEVFTVTHTPSAAGTYYLEIMYTSNNSLVQTVGGSLRSISIIGAKR